jgi:hypothetical protein
MIQTSIAISLFILITLFFVVFNLQKKPYITAWIILAILFMIMTFFLSTDSGNYPTLKQPSYLISEYSIFNTEY